jgi:hypothetical protein
MHGSGVRRDRPHAAHFQAGARGAGSVMPMLIPNDLNIRLQMQRRFRLLHHLVKPMRRTDLFGVVHTLAEYDDDAVRSASDASALISNATSGAFDSAELLAAPDATEAIVGEADISFDAGCDTHVSKPVRRPALAAAIREVTAKPERETQRLPEEAGALRRGALERIATASHTCASASLSPPKSDRTVRMN